MLKTGKAAASQPVKPAPKGRAPAASEEVLNVPQDVQDDVTAALRERMNMDAIAEMPRDELIRQAEEAIHQIGGDRRIQLTMREQHQLAKQIADEIQGVGPLQQLLDDDTVNDVMVNGPKSVFVERHGQLVKTGVVFRDETHVRQLAQRIARNVGRRLDEQSPLVDARLSDGSRVNIVMPPVSLVGTLISIRRFPNNPITLDQMVAGGAMDRNIRTFLETAAKGRLNLVISGGTGSGKTTLLNACSQFIEPKERVITIEDAAELRLQQPHVLPLETRPASLEGTVEITQRELVKNALRMRPDRIILGEVRQGEAFDMLQAMNTGHDGSMGTMHANNPRDALARLENMILMAGFELPMRAIRNQIVSAIDLIVQVERMPDGQRRIISITEVTGIEGDVVTLQDLFAYNVKDNRSGKLQGEFQTHNVTPHCLGKLKRLGLDSVMRAIFTQQSVI